MTDWISVKDRLPETFQAVIVCRKGKAGELIVEAGSLDIDGRWRVYGTRTKSVTHWMPLPDPPEVTAPWPTIFRPPTAEKTSRRATVATPAGIGGAGSNGKRIAGRTAATGSRTRCCSAQQRRRLCHDRLA